MRAKVLLSILAWGFITACTHNVGLREDLPAALMGTITPRPEYSVKIKYVSSLKDPYVVSNNGHNYEFLLNTAFEHKLKDYTANKFPANATPEKKSGYR